MKYKFLIYYLIYYILMILLCVKFWFHIMNITKKISFLIHFSSKCLQGMKTDQWMNFLNLPPMLMFTCKFHFHFVISTTLEIHKKKSTFPLITTFIAQALQIHYCDTLSTWRVVIVTMFQSFPCKITLGPLHSTRITFLLLIYVATATAATLLFLYYALRLLCTDCHIDKQIFVAFRSWNVVGCCC